MKNSKVWWKKTAYVLETHGPWLPDHRESITTRLARSNGLETPENQERERGWSEKKSQDGESGRIRE